MGFDSQNQMKFEGLLRELWHSKWVVFRFVIKVYLLAIPRTLLYIEDLLNQGSTVHSRQDKTRQDKTFIIKISPVQFLGTQLAKKR